jgi:hypothetical protein
VQGIILAHDTVLHVAIGDLDSTEDLEVFVGVDDAAADLDVLQELVPVLDVFTEQLVHLVELDVPQRLV